MKTEIRYRIKDLTRSTEKRDVFITNASNSTIYKSKKHVAKKLKDLVKRDRYSYDELVVFVFELKPTGMSESKTFMDSVIGVAEKIEKAKVKKQNRLNEAKSDIKRYTGLSFEDAYDLFYSKSSLLNEESRYHLNDLFNLYHNINNQALAEFY